MAILYKEDAIDLKELPANITELYNKFSDYYLDRWDATKGLSAQYKFEETKHILAFIGQYMHVRGMREIDIPQLSGFLQEIYDKFSYDELTDIQGFIEKLKIVIAFLYTMKPLIHFVLTIFHSKNILPVYSMMIQMNKN